MTHTKITQYLSERGMAWAVRSDKYCGADDPLDDQIEGRRTYHIHPDRSNPHQDSIMRFRSLAEIGRYLKARDAADANPERGWEIMQEYWGG